MPRALLKFPSSRPSITDAPPQPIISKGAKTPPEVPDASGRLSGEILERGEQDWSFVVPDLAAWRRERMSSMPAKAYIETPPDWVCEVISLPTEAIDKGPKRRIYATYHVPYLWHLNPAAKLLEVFELKDEHWVLFEVFQDNEQVAAPPFSAVPFSLADLWPLDMLPEQAP